MIDQARLELLVSTAESMGLNPKVVPDSGGLVSISVGGKERYLFHKSSNPNAQMASWLSKNKYLTRLITEKHGVPNIPYRLTSDVEEAKAFLAEHGKIIVKPLRGMKSRGIHLVTAESELTALDLTDCLLEKFIKGQETRILVVNGVVKGYQFKVYEGEVNTPDTVQRVAFEESDWNMELVDLAVKAADALGLVFTAVDFLATDGGAYLLEVNSAPGIDRFQHPNQGPSIDMMRTYLELVVASY